MTDDRHPNHDLEIDAYIDGRLSGADARRVEARLENDPALTAHVERCLEDRRVLKDLFDPILEEAPPQRLLAPIRRRKHRSPTTAGLWGRRIAAALACMMIGWLAAGRFATSEPAPTSSLQLAAAFAEGSISSPVSAGPAPAGLWGAMPERLDHQLDLLGARRTDVRTMTGDRGQSIVAMTFEDADGSQVHLILQPRSFADPPDPEIVDVAGRPVAYWNDGPVAAALAGDLDEDRLGILARSLGQALRRQEVQWLVTPIDPSFETIDDTVVHDEGVTPG